MPNVSILPVEESLQPIPKFELFEPPETYAAATTEYGVDGAAICKIRHWSPVTKGQSIAMPLPSSVYVAVPWFTAVKFASTGGVNFAP